MTQRIRGYVVWVRGFALDPVDVYVRATSRARARYLCALAYKNAGWGSIGEGLRNIARARLDASADDRPLVLGSSSGEGLVVPPWHTPPTMVDDFQASLW